MKWLCKIGFHKWFAVQSLYTPFKNRVCLRCERVEWYDPEFMIWLEDK